MASVFGIESYAVYDAPMVEPLTDEQMDRVLETQVYAHLGCFDGTEMYIVPITYLWRDGSIFSYSDQGKKLSIMHTSPAVCVQVERVTPERWESVLCWGTFEEITDADEIHALRLKFAEQCADAIRRGDAVVSPLIRDLPEKREGKPWPAIYRIRINRRTGRGESREQITLQTRSR